MFVTIVQLKQRKVIANVVIVQNKNKCNACVCRIKINDSGAAKKLPNAQMSGSAWAYLLLSLEVI